MVEIIDENFFKHNSSTAAATPASQQSLAQSTAAAISAQAQLTTPPRPQKLTATPIAKQAQSAANKQPTVITSVSQAHQAARALQTAATEAQPSAKKAAEQTITMIAAQKHRQGRYNLYLNGQFALGISEMVLVKYRLHKGMTITPQLLDELTTAETFAQAYAAALNYLSYSLRSRHELVTKLRSLAVPAAQIDAICAKLSEQRLLDDAAYARSFVRTQRNTQAKGPTVIARKLKQKGIAEALITSALTTEFDEATQLSQAKQLAPKFWRRYRSKPVRMQRSAVITALITAGYPTDCATAAAQATQPTTDMAAETDKLTQTATKLLRRYQAKPNGKNKFIAAMMRRGFEFSAIQQYLAHANITFEQ